MSERGFTLIELLVVMIILGVLAAIAIPVFLSQRAKAHDSATKADVSNLGKEVATYFVDSSGPLTVHVVDAHRIDLVSSSFTTFARLTVGSTLPAEGAFSHLDDPMAWCVALTDPRGSMKTFRYTALDGLGIGACS